MANKAYVYNGSAWVEITSQPTVPTATTGNAGIVQLVDSTSSVSTADAATPNSVKTAYDRGSLGVTNAATAQATANAAVSPTGTQTLTNKTLTAPKFDTAGKIDDINGNELIKFPATVASAVNEVTISNAAAGAAPSISASGTDTNIDLSLAPKGTGNVSATKLRLSSTEDAGTTSTEHAIQVGPTNGLNLRIDNNEIIALNNGVVSPLYLQNDGGIITVAANAAGQVNLQTQTPLRFYDADNTNYVALRAPTAVSADATWTLPSADGTNGQVLTTNGSGALSFGTAASGSGAFTLITETSFSSTSSIVYSNISGSYRNLVWVCFASTAGSGGVYFSNFVRGTSTAISQIFLNAVVTTGTTTLSSTRLSTSTTQIGTGSSGSNLIGTGTTHGGVFTLYDYSTTNANKFFTLTGNADTTASNQTRFGIGSGYISVGASAAITGFTVNWAGAPSTGSAFLYGVS